MNDIKKVNIYINYMDLSSNNSDLSSNNSDLSSNNIDSVSRTPQEIIERIVSRIEHFPPEHSRLINRLIGRDNRQSPVQSDEENSVSDGSDAQLAWFKCTDSQTKIEEKENYKKELLKYCANDTKAMYDLILYFLKSKN